MPGRSISERFKCLKNAHACAFAGGRSLLAAQLAEGHDCTRGLRPNAHSLGGMDVKNASCSPRNESPR